MTKIEELLKNEKVEWKKLEEVCEILDYKRKPITKSKRIRGKIPYYGANGIQDYVNDYIFDGTFILMGEDGSVMNKDNTPILHWIERNKIWVNNHAHVLGKMNDNYNLRYIYYYLSITNVSTIVKGLPPKINQANLRLIKIPIPPLETQEKIVKILDKFTNYVTELQSRTKQYNYYRDKLLSEECLNKISNKLEGLEDKREISWSKISDVCLRQKGINVTAGEMKELNKIGALVRIFAGGNTIADVDEENVGKDNVIKKDSIIVKSRGNIDFEFYDKPFSHKNELWSYSSLNKEILNIKFLYYYLKSNLQYFRDSAISGKLPQISIGNTDNYKVPLPHIDIQNKIVEILDKFQELLKDTKGLLPQEIEQRQKQYEYYREKLLTFDEKYGNTHTIIPNNFFNLLKEAVEVVGVNLENKVVKISLENIAVYSQKRISASYLNESNYVGVDNLLKDKLGKVNSSYVPSEGNLIKFQKGATLIGNIRPYLRKIWYADIEGGTNGDVLVVHIKEDYRDQILSKFLYQLLADEKFFDYSMKFSKGAKMPRGDKKKIMKYEVLIPSIFVQKYVVSILDKFDTLINDLSRGLPKEIELRQKQYEYYREKLLDFPKEN